MSRRHPAGDCYPTTTAMTEPATTDTPTPRSTQMLLMHEELARARMRARRDQAGAEGRASRVAAARRWQRRADTASRRAREARDLLA